MGVSGDHEKELEAAANMVAEKLAGALHGKTELEKVVDPIEDTVNLIKTVLSKGATVDYIEATVYGDPDVEVVIRDCSNGSGGANNVAACLDIAIKSSVFCDSILSYFSDDFLGADDLMRYVSYLGRVSERLTRIAEYLRRNPHDYVYLGTYRELYGTGGDTSDCCSMEIVHEESLEVSPSSAPSRDSILGLVSSMLRVANDLRQLSGSC